MNPVLKAIASKLADTLKQNPAAFISALESALPMLELAAEAQLLNLIIPGDGAFPTYVKTHPTEVVKVIKDLVQVAKGHPEFAVAALKEVAATL